MADNYQIVARVSPELVEWIDNQPERKIGLSFSKTVKTLLEEAKDHRELKKPTKTKKNGN